MIFGLRLLAEEGDFPDPCGWWKMLPVPDRGGNQRGPQSAPCVLPNDTLGSA
jgi:hypothetical protein